MIVPSAGAFFAWRKHGRRQRLHRRMVNARKFLMMRMIASSACAVGLLLGSAGYAAAGDVGSVIVLPDAPFVIPLNAQPTSGGQRNVTTQLNNNARQGAYLAETQLTPSNVQVQTFGRLLKQQVKGQVLAQPLYVRDVAIEGFGVRNLVVVATAANMVYALDANDLSIVFQKQLTPEPIPVDPTKNNSLTSVCAETYPPFIGVTSTPVIDATIGVVFVVSFNPINAQQEIHALNLHDHFASDKKVTILPPGESSDSWPKSHRNRAGLLLSKGIIYVAFSSFICDHPQPYAGWVMGYSANDLKLVAHWKTPNPGSSGSSGIWQGGRGLVASDNGEIYLMTGNDSNFSDLRDYTSDLNDFKDPRLANSFVKLNQSGPDGLTAMNSFSPKNSSQLSAGDTDIGSSGPILLPDDRLIGGGKQGRVYVLDTSSMRSLQDRTKPGDDGFQGFQAFINTYHTDSRQNSCTKPFDNGNPDKYCRELHAEDILNNKKCLYDQVTAKHPNGCYLPSSCYQFCQAYGPNLHAGFVYWQPAFDWGLIYAMPEKEHVKAFKYDIVEKKVEESPAATSQLLVPDGMPGGALSLSANGNQDGILWVSMPNREDATSGVHRGSLVALDAKDLHQLWQDDCIWYFAKFNPPTIADGRVFLATFADPVVDPKLARTPGEGCDTPDLEIPLFPPDLTKPVGWAWIIEYGLK